VGATPGGGLVDVAVGGSHACAVLTDGRVACWGANGAGQLGDGTAASRAYPVQADGAGDAIAVALGGGLKSGHTCALAGDGHAWCWGLDDYGQLGLGGEGEQAPPRALPLKRLRAIAAGTWHTCAIARDTTLSCWGRTEAFGPQVLPGDATHTDEPAPIGGLERVVGVALGQLHTCALTSPGDVLCWGSGGDGRLGTGREAHRAKPGRVEALPASVAIAAGAAHTCALDTDGSVWCWGANDEGQLGNGSKAPSAGTPSRVRGLPEAFSLDAGRAHTCAIVTGNEVRCWGANDAGQLGDGTDQTRHNPAAVRWQSGTVDDDAGTAAD
jgi:alpha-tubulin suppressor-like RCC1 family protein